MGILQGVEWSQETFELPSVAAGATGELLTILNDKTELQILQVEVYCLSTDYDLHILTGDVIGLTGTLWNPFSVAAVNLHSMTSQYNLHAPFIRSTTGFSAYVINNDGGNATGPIYLRITHVGAKVE